MVDKSSAAVASSSETEADEASTNGKTKKAKLVNNFYVDAAGERTARPGEDVVGIVKEFLDENGKVVHTLDVKLSDLPANIRPIGLAFGVHQVIQNSYGGVTDLEERIESADDRLATLLSGKWADARQSGPRTSDLFEAWVAARREQLGSEPDQEWKDLIKGKIDSEEYTSKDILAKPKIRAQYDAIKLARATERAKKSAERAGDAEDDLSEI